MPVETEFLPSTLPLHTAGIRHAIRAERHTSHTAGLAPGKLQCNLAILPAKFALEFFQFCKANPKPCPLVGMGEPGNVELPDLGEDIDVRTDVPRYRVFENGQHVRDVKNILDLWRPDLVAFALGCSFTFENALLRAGVPVRHLEMGRNVPMYRSNIQLSAVPPFEGHMVVTMRPIPEDKLDEAYEISGRYPQAHGAPIAHGDAKSLGIADLSKPDFGDPVEIRGGEVPVFWACGVTPQNVLLNASLPLSITHSPGHMLITDVSEQDQKTIFETEV